MSLRRFRALDAVSEPAQFVVRGRSAALARLAATAFAGGLLEAVFLVTVTRAAFAVTEGSERIGVIGGWYLSMAEGLLFAAGLIVARMAIGAWAGWQAGELATAVVAATRLRLGSAFLRSSWSVRQHQRGGSLQELMAGYSNHTSTLMSALNQALIATANLFAMIGLAVVVDPLGALVLVISVAVLGSLLRPLRAGIRRRSQRTARANMQLAVGVHEASSLGMDLQVFNVESAAEESLSVRIDDARSSTKRLMFAQSLITPAYVGLAYLALVGALSFVAVSDVTSLTSLGAAMLVMLRALSYGQALQSSIATVSSSTPVLQELVRHLGVFEAGARRDGGEPLRSVRTIAAENVSFGYNAEEGPVLRDMSFEIPSQQVVGIVGPSGSGKSTLVQLLLRLRSPDQGKILVDGRDIDRFAAEHWARRVTFVPQEAHLISGTVEDNIRFMRQGVSRDEIVRAAQLAHLHDEISSMPGGYGRVLGDEGARLSGGQQQRLTIARALVEQPDVLILDEPTSALDVRSEHLIRTTLQGLKKKMTVIVIAHRLSTLEICDRIMVVQDGRLVAFDSPAVLESSNEFYREALVLSGLR